MVFSSAAPPLPSLLPTHLLRSREISGQSNLVAGETIQWRMSRNRCRACTWEEVEVEGSRRSRSMNRNAGRRGGRSGSSREEQRDRMEFMPCLRHKALNAQMKEKISPSGGGEGGEGGGAWGAGRGAGIDCSRSDSRSRNRCRSTISNTNGKIQ